MDGRPNWPTRLYAASVTAAWQALLTAALLFVVVAFLLIANLGFARLYPMPIHWSDGTIAILGLVGLFLAGFSTALYVDSRYVVQPPEGKGRRGLYHGLDSMETFQGKRARRRAIRYLGFSTGCFVGLVVLVKLPNLLPSVIVGVALATLACASVLVGLSSDGVFVPEAGFGATLVLFAVPAVRIYTTLGDAIGLRSIPTGIVLLGLVWLPALGVKTRLAFGPRPARRITVPLVMALLVAGGVLIAAPGNSKPTVALDVSEEVDLSDPRTVEYLESDVSGHRDIVHVGTLDVENPFLFRRPVAIPDVRGCLYTPERHDVDVLQVQTESSYGTKYLYPANRYPRVDGRSTRKIGLELPLDKLEDVKSDSLGTIPVEVADSCPEQSDEVKLVIYTTDGYDPGGWA